MLNELMEQLGREVREEQEAVQAFDEAAARLLGINLTDLWCLGILQRKGRMPANELAKETGLTTGSVTALIDRLERAEYVRRERDDRDRRRVFVELTERARQATVDVWGPLGREAIEVASGYSERDLRIVVEYLRTSKRILQKHVERVRNMPRRT